MGEERLDRLRVVERAMDSTAVWGPERHGTREGAVRAEAHPRRLREDLVERRKYEVGELDLRHGSKACDRGADRDADDHRFGERRIEHAVATELVVQPVGGQEDAAFLAYVLTQNDDRFVASHLLGERVAHCFDQGHDGHQSSPLASSVRTPHGPPSPMNRSVFHNGSSMRAGGLSA